MALGYVSGSDSLTESLRSRCSPFRHPTHSYHSQKTEHSLSMCASPSSENQYSEIGAITGASGLLPTSSPDYGLSAQVERSVCQYHGSAHDLRSPQYLAQSSAPRHHSADILSPTGPARHQPRIMNPRHQRVAPPKPRRLHVAQDIYTMPTSSGEKRQNPFDQRRAWSPLALTPGGGQLHKMRCYRSNEQLDTTEGDSEQLDTISNSSAPPKIAPHSGKLNKMTPDDIIKPVAFKPIITPVNHFSPCRPSPPQSLLPARQPHLTSDLNRSHDDGYQSQDGNHLNQRDAAAVAQTSQPAPLCSSVSSSQLNGQASYTTCRTNQALPNTSYTGNASFEAGYPSPTTSHASLDRNHAYSRHTNSGSLDRAMRMLYGHAYMDASRASSSDAGSTLNNANHAFLSTARVTMDEPQPSVAQPSHASSESSHSYLNTSHTSHTSSNLSRACSSDGSHASSQVTPASCHASPACVYGNAMEDMEAMLRHKEAELRRLRETMDRNERALLQVYEEKRQNWEAELRDRCNDWQQKLDAAYHKSFRTEQALLIQLFKLQEERRALRKDNEQLQHGTKNLEQRCTDLEQQLQQAKAQADELNWELQQRSGEISLLKTHLKDEKEQASSRNSELVSLRSQIKELREERDQLRKDMQQMASELKQSSEQFENSKKDLMNDLDMAKNELEKLREDNTKEKICTEQRQQQVEADQMAHHKEQVAALADELTKTKSRLVEVEEEFMRERSRWLTEKDKVIRYQKHLQLNYIQAMRKNKLLEDDVEQLTLELEQHNIKLMARAAGPEEAAARAGITLMEEEESIC